MDIQKITSMAKNLFLEEKSKKRLDGWFLTREIVCNHNLEFNKLPLELRAAKELEAIVKELPLSISENAIFVGSQSDAFARSYALINPEFQVETFSGYCDPTAVYNDILVNEEFTEERIKRVKEFVSNTDYVKELSAVYDKYNNYTSEVAFFVEQVTGHIIPDFKIALKKGLNYLISELDNKINNEFDEVKKINFSAMKISLESAVILINRYREIVEEKLKFAKGERVEQLLLMKKNLNKIRKDPCDTLYESIQLYMILWEMMCLEQAPNPFAFSLGNVDRIFEPFRKKENLSRDQAAALFKHFLVFFNVGDRSWAISQNMIISGKDIIGNDLTNEMSYAIIDAFYDMNLPQPILSVKVHKNTPNTLYAELGKFFFSPGVLTPSIFNDETIFSILANRQVENNDIPNYSIAGCQEPLIMGKENGNTTNSWLNLPKILELTLNNGKSIITGKIIEKVKETQSQEILKNIRNKFYENVNHYVDLMCNAANEVSQALANLPVPFLSVFMGGISSGYDMRDTKHQGTKYNGSGCLVHGLSVIADSFVAIDKLLIERPEDADNLIKALKSNFVNYEELHNFLKKAPKFGNNIPSVDQEASEIVIKISDIIASHNNYLGNPFRADWATPTTHLLYGYWVGATPDGRKAREQLNYGIDPLFGDANQGMGFRMLSNMQLPFGKMSGGCASHYGIDPKYFKANTIEQKGIDFANRVIRPLFFNKDNNDRLSPFYLYVNVTTPETLRKVLAEPKKYAPSGVYIMRIHGTFVNFLDLSPDIQQDIIKRLDLESTGM